MLIAKFYNEKDKAIVSGAWQYDYGQKLYVHGLELPEVVEIGFSLTETGGMDYPRFAITKDGVTEVAIPDEMMEGNDVESDYRIYAFIFIEDEKQESGQTIKSIEIRVKSRPKRWMDDETGDNFSEIVKAVRDLVEEYKKSGVSDEQVKAALEDYLADHPIDTLTEEEVRAIVSAMLGDVTQTHFEKVDVLPDEGEENIIYLVPAENTEEQNIYDEYIFLNGIPELIGTTKINLEGYATKEDFRHLSDTVNDLKENGTGTTVTGGSVKTILANIMTIMRAQINPDGTPQIYNPDISSIADITDELIASLGTTEEPDIPDEPTDPSVTLSSISAIYTGGNVTVGTALSSLKGITVTAHYSDGSKAIVTGYTLNGAIIEGVNTITVSYGGLTTTFTVTGVAESEGGTTNITQTGSTLTIIDVPNVTQSGTTLIIG